VVLVDTNVLLDLFTADKDWADWSEFQLRAHAQVHRLLINPFIYAETSLAFDSPTLTDDALAALGIDVAELPREALFLAGRAHVHYRRQGGAKSKILTDFFIGAHAAVNDLILLTRDAARYRNYFPTVKLISPPRH
jgi:predicted nucleic acid-binding protein